MSFCGKISTGLQLDCEYPLIGGVKDNLILINYDDIDSVTRNGVNRDIIEDITLITGTTAYLFEGKNNSIETESILIKQRYAEVYDHQVSFKVFLSNPNSKLQLEKIVQNKLVAIVYNNMINEDGDTAFEIYGLGIGLCCEEITRVLNDQDTQSAYSVILKTPEQVKEPTDINTFFKDDYLTTKALVEGLLSLYSGCINVIDLGIVSSDVLDQTDLIRTILETPGNLCVAFPVGNYRCRNLYIRNDNQQIIIDGTIKNIDGTLFNVTQDALEGQKVIYIEDATVDQLNYLEMLINEAPDYYYYVGFFDELYTTEGGGTGQTHHNAWISRLTGVNKVSKYITIKDNIPSMPNYCGGTLHVANSAVVTVLYNVFEVDACLNPKFSGSGTIDANRYNFVDLNPVWISGEEGHPEFAGSGANFIECFSVRFGYGFEMSNLNLRDGKDNIMLWYMNGYLHLNGVKSYNAHNKNISLIISGEEDFPDIEALFENCEANGSDYEDGFIGYTSADNLTIRNCIARNCPRNGFSWNRWTSHGNYAENLEAYGCGTSYTFNRGGITELLTVRNIYSEGGVRHWQVPSYQPAVEIRSQIASKCGYINLINVGIIYDLHTSAFQIYKAEEIEIVWEIDCADKYKLIQGKFSIPHSFGYFVRIDALSTNIVIDGGGVLEVTDFPYLFQIKTGSTGVVIKNCRFSNYLSIGEVDSLATFQDNYFDDVFYATGYPLVPPAILMFAFDASLGVTRSGENVSEWQDQSDEENHATQATVSLQPNWLDDQINNLPAIFGDGVDDIMNLVESLNCPADFTLFAIIGGNISPGYMFGYSSTIYWRFTGYSLTWKNSTSQIFDHSNVPLDSGYFLHRLTRVSGSCRSYRNTIESLTGPLTNSVQMLIRYLFTYGVTNFGIGGLAELRVIAGTLSPEEITNTETALMDKYNLEIPVPLEPVEGLILQFDASLEVTLSGEDVTGWGDQSESDNDATQVTTDLQPHLIEDQVNGLSVIKGDGSDDIMNLDSTILLSGDFTVFIVCGGTIDPSYMFGHSSTIYTRIRQSIVTWRNSTTHTFDHSDNQLDTGYFIHHMTRRSGNVRSYRNNIESITGAVSNSTQYALSKLFSFGTSYGSGAIAEFRLYDDTITEDDVADILTELSVKFNIPIT